MADLPDLTLPLPAPDLVARVNSTEDRVAALEADSGTSGPGGGAVSGYIDQGALVLTLPDPPGQVTPAAPVFDDQPGAASDTYTIPSTAHVSYHVNGTPASAGTYPGTGSITVTAVADSGYALIGYPPGGWSHTFSTAIVVSPYEQAVMDLDPLAYYPFSESTTPFLDRVGDTSQAHLDGATPGAIDLGAGGTSVDFSGASATSGFTSSPLASIGTSKCVEALVHVDTIGQRMTIFTVADQTRGGEDEMIVVRVAADGRLELLAYDAAGSLLSPSLIGTSVLSAGTTAHVAWTWTDSDTRHRVYLNGAEELVLWTDAGRNALAAPVLSVGWRPGAVSGFEANLDGKAAGVAAYAGTLTPAQLLDHAQKAGVI